MAEVIATPCIKICRIVEQLGLCEGCGRTLGEIAAWSSLTAAQRAAIMQRLAQQRGRSLDAAPAS